MPVQPPQWTDFLSCPICYTVFNENAQKPISLACGHTMCKRCLANLSKKQCPFDQATIQRDVDELPVNFALLQLVGIEISLERDVVPSNIIDQYVKHYAAAKRCVEELALYLKPLGKGGASIGACVLSRPMQRKLVALLNCQLVEDEGRSRALRAARSLGERTVTELILQHQNPQQLSANLWAAVRGRGCQFLGPAMQEETLKLVLLALEDGTALSRKVLVLFVVQRLEPQFPQASKTSVGHVVQLLYRASCFKVTKRDSDSSLMQLKEEFRNYEALRREHDAQIVQIAMEAGLRISPEQWSSLLYGDLNHKSHMQSIIDKLQTPASFSSSINELTIALQRSGDPGNLKLLQPHLEYLAEIDGSTESNCSSWEDCEHAMRAVKLIVQGFVDFAQNFSHTRKMISQQTPNVTFKTTMCRDIQKGGCPRGSNCTFAHSDKERKEHRAESRRLMQTMSRQTSQSSIGEPSFEKKPLVARGIGSTRSTPSPGPTSALPNIERETSSPPYEGMKRQTVVGYRDGFHPDDDGNLARIYGHQVHQDNHEKEGVARMYSHAIQPHTNKDENVATSYRHGRHPPPPPHVMYHYEDPYYYEAYSPQGYRYAPVRGSSPPRGPPQSFAVVRGGHTSLGRHSPVHNQHPGPYRHKVGFYDTYEGYVKQEASNYPPGYRQPEPPPTDPQDYQYLPPDVGRHRQPYSYERNGSYRGCPPSQPVGRRGWEQALYRRAPDVADQSEQPTGLPIQREFARDKASDIIDYRGHDMRSRMNESKIVSATERNTNEKSSELSDTPVLQAYNVPSIDQLNEREATLIDLLSEMSRITKPSEHSNTILEDAENPYHTGKTPQMPENQRHQYSDDFSRLYRQNSSKDPYSTNLPEHKSSDTKAQIDDIPVYEMWSMSHNLSYQFPANKEVCTKLTPTLSKTHIRHVSTYKEDTAKSFQDFHAMENLSLNDMKKEIVGKNPPQQYIDHHEQQKKMMLQLEKNPEMSPLVISTTNLTSKISPLLNSPEDTSLDSKFGPISRSCRTLSKISGPVQVSAGKNTSMMPVKLNLDCHTAPALQEPSGYYSGFQSPWSNEYSTMSWDFGERLPSLTKSGGNEEEQKRKIKEELKFVQSQIQYRKDATDIQLVDRESKAIAEHNISCKIDSKLLEDESHNEPHNESHILTQVLDEQVSVKDNLVWAKHCVGKNREKRGGQAGN